MKVGLAGRCLPSPHPESRRVFFAATSETPSHAASTPHCGRIGRYIFRLIRHDAAVMRVSARSPVPFMPIPCVHADDFVKHLPRTALKMAGKPVLSSDRRSGKGASIVSRAIGAIIVQQLSRRRTGSSGGDRLLRWFRIAKRTFRLYIQASDAGGLRLSQAAIHPR